MQSLFFIIQQIIGKVNSINAYVPSNTTIMIDVIMRAFIGFAVLLLLTRFLGKKQLSQLTVFTYITGIALGSMASEMIIHDEITITNGVTSMVIWCILSVGVEFVALKNARARILLDGEPAVVIRQGRILEQSLRKHRLNLDDLTMQLRLNNVFTILDVEYAILEPNGALTVMKKSAKESVTKEDMNIPAQGGFLPGELICDGKLVKKNLDEFGLTRKQLDNKLKKQGVKNIKQVFYAEVGQDKSLHIQKR